MKHTLLSQRKSSHKHGVPQALLSSITSKQHRDATRNPRSQPQATVQSTSVYSYGRARVDSVRMRKLEKPVYETLYIAADGFDTKGYISFPRKQLGGRTLDTIKDITTLRDLQGKPLYRRLKNGAIVSLEDK